MPCNAGVHALRCTDTFSCVLVNFYLLLIASDIVAAGDSGQAVDNIYHLAPTLFGADTGVAKWSRLLKT